MNTEPSPEEPEQRASYAVPWVPATPVPRPVLDWHKTTSSARVYKSLLRRRLDFQPDAAVLGRLSAHDVRQLCSAATVNAHHAFRVVSRLARDGFDQFVDLGCGYERGAPTVDTLHAYARRVLPACRVVSVDIDPVVIGTRWNAESSPHEETTVQGDLRHMRTLLTSEQVSSVLDRSRPVAILLHDVLPCLDDTEAAEALEVLRDWAPAGSALSITHATDLAPVTPSRLTPLMRQAADLTYLPRPWEAVKAFFGDWPLLEPGLVPTARWVPMGDVRDRPSGAYAGVAIKPVVGAAEGRQA